ncbi:hypothetical protein Goari_020819 [Gossypium aridum]|uniref:Uncharacterized protein n=1 Tax=Gossypium aridum TaxID=34290 RepID=A0A7J8YCG2_GOSAI|nr:hypothetical protein [Gossypium aridum]
MKREYVKARNSVLVLNMRFAFLAALSRMLMKLLLVRMGFPRKYMHTSRLDISRSSTLAASTRSVVRIVNTEESEEVRKGEWKVRIHGYKTRL